MDRQRLKEEQRFAQRARRSSPASSRLQSQIGNRAAARLYGRQVGDGITRARAVHPTLMRELMAPRNGHPLRSDLRQAWRNKTGDPASRVELHYDNQAARMAFALNARAFTFGKHIYFGANQYRPNETSGRRLIAHELAHTHRHSNPVGHTVRVSNSTRAEHEADQYLNLLD